MTALRGLRIAAAVEALTLVALLTNVATAHEPGVATALGPVHGTAYLAGIALAWTADLPRKARLFACIPGVGAWLATRTATSGEPWADRPHSREYR